MNKIQYKELKSRPFFEQIIEQIRTQIIAENLKPGYPTPREKICANDGSESSHCSRGPKSFRIHGCSAEQNRNWDSY